MKKSILIIFVCLISSLQITFAQTIPIGENLVDNITYKVVLHDNNLNLSIYNKNKPAIPENKEVTDNLGPIELSTKPKNLNQWQKLVIDILPSKTVQELKNRNEKLLINFYVKPTGEIYYVTFYLNKNTVLTLQDIHKIDRYLMNNYKINMESLRNRHLQLSWLRFTSELDFSKY